MTGVTMFETLIVIVLLAATVPFTQGELLVTEQLTVLPSARPALLYVGLFVPTGEPLSIH